MEIFARRVHGKGGGSGLVSRWTARPVRTLPLRTARAGERSTGPFASPPSFRPRVALDRAPLRRSGGRKVHWTFRFRALVPASCRAGPRATAALGRAKGPLDLSLPRPRPYKAPMTAFVKMHGLGNDFVVFDARDTAVSLDAAKAKAIADRHLGVGCDTVVLI